MSWFFFPSLNVFLWSVLFLGVCSLHTLGTMFCLVVAGSGDQRMGEDAASGAARWLLRRIPETAATVSSYWFVRYVNV